jgi:capsular polysaccharide transport system ATP-binding protein
MIVLDSVRKVFGHGRTRRVVLDDVSAVFKPQSHYVILGGRGAGKSTLLRLLSDLQQPTGGTIERYGTVSPPLGTPIASGNQTGRQLALLISDLYRADSREILDFVARFAQLDEEHMTLPIPSLQHEARLRLYYALGYAVPVDYYLFDMTVVAGDAGFQAQCRAAFELRRKDAGSIFVTRDPRRARSYGERGGVLHAGSLYLYDTVDEAMDVFASLEAESRIGTLSYADALVQQGDMAGAQEYVRQYLAEAGDDVDAYAMLAELGLKSGDLQEAIDASQAMLERAPDQADTHVMLARVSERESRFRDAIDHAARALELRPDDRDSMMLLARCCEGLSLHSDAAAVWRKLAEIEQNPLFLRLAIRCDVKAENWTGVLGSIDAIGADSGLDAGLLDLRTQALIEADRLDEVHDAIVEIAARDFSRAIAGIYRLAQHKQWAAVIRLVHALRTYPWAGQLTSRTVTLLLVLLERQGVQSAREGRSEEADQLLQTVRIVDPSRPPSYLRTVRDAVSVGKPVSMSSQHLNHKAEYGNDGEIFVPRKMFCTKREHGPWWKLDLGEIVPIGSIWLFDWVEQMQRVASLVVETSTDDESYRIVHTRDGAATEGTGGSRPAPREFEPTTRIRVNAPGRWVRLRLRDANYLHMRQVVVLRPGEVAEDDLGAAGVAGLSAGEGAAARR